MSNVISEFEETIAKYAGAKYGVAISSGSNAIFLCLLYLKSRGILMYDDIVTIPSKTYLSVPMAIKNAGLEVEFDDTVWFGAYPLKGTNIIDSATRFRKGMYIPDTLYVLSFQYRKHIPIGRGGMVLTDDKEAVEWLKMARFNGKHEGVDRFKDVFEMVGWDMYMTPEQASRGLLIFKAIGDDNPDKGSYKDYPDLSKQKVFK